MFGLNIPSLIRNFLHIGGGGTMFYWLLGMFHVTPTMINDVWGAIGTIVTIGATIWSQNHASKAPAAPPAK